MNKLLILGATGMLGHKLCQLLPARGFEVVGTTRRGDDLRSTYPGVYDHCQLVATVDVLDDRVLHRVVSDVQPDVLINCVGIVKQKKAASDRLLSIAINSYLPHKLAEICRQQGRRLVHISTDCVFTGSRGAYHEDDPSDAADLYGKSKYLGETTAEQTCALTLRTSIVGREIEEPGHGLLSWFLSQRGRRVRGFAKAVFSGLTTNELARTIALVLDEHPDLCGLRHVASSPINKYDLLCLIRRLYGLDVDVEYDEEDVVDRSLIMDQFKNETGYEPPDWETMIRQMQADPTPNGRWKEMAVSA